MKDGYIQDCFAVQTDSARVLDFQVVEDGKYADLSGVDILLYVAEGDKAIYSTGDIVDAKNGRFRVELFNQQLLRPGKHKAQIEMTSGGKSISSPIFYIDVEKSIKSGAEAGVNIALDFQEMKEIKKVVEQIELNIEREHSDIKKYVELNKQDFDEKKSDFDSKYQGVLDIVSAEQARVEAEKLRATHDEKLQKLFEKGIEAELEGCIRPNLLNGTSNKWYEILIDDGADKENKCFYIPGMTLPVTLLKKNTLYTGSYTIELSDLDLGEDPWFELRSPGDKTGWDAQLFLGFLKNGVSNGLYKIVKTIYSDDKLCSNTVFDEFSIRTDHIKSGKIRIKDIKIEEGTTATAWCPSVEDIAKSISKKLIATSIPEYRLSTSNTSIEGGNGEWMDYIYDSSDGLYLWQRMKNTYSDGSEDYTKPVCVKARINEKELVGTVAKLKGIVKQLQEKIK